MSRIPFIKLGELNGTHGWVKTKGFVNWIDDVATHKPYQRVGLGDNSTKGEHVVCTVWTDDIELEEGVGYWFGGVDDVWEAGDEIQLKLVRKSWANEFWRRD